MAHMQFPISDINRCATAPRRPRRRAGRSAPCLLAIAAACLALAGCTSAPKQAYPETFKDTNTYSRSYQATDAATCEAARRALLSQGYTIGKAQTDGVEGQKNFQVQDEDKQHQVISFHVVCTSDHQASPHTTVFVNAVQDRYIIKKTSSSAGVGLSVLGSVSMPFGSSDDSLAKVSSETISASSFYDGFFDLLQRYLPQSQPPDGAAQKTSAGAKTPDVKPPDAKTPDVKSPDAKTPDAKTPDVTSPDAKTQAPAVESPSAPPPSTPSDSRDAAPTPTPAASGADGKPLPAAP